MTLFSYDEMLSTLRARFPAMPLEKAEAIARAECGLPALLDPVESAKDASIREKEEQQEIYKRFKAVGGFVVYWLSQPRIPKQTPGIPDLWCMHPSYPIAFWWESKRQVGGEHSEAQLTFARLSAECGVGYGSGDRHDAGKFLVALGLAEQSGEAFEPLRPLIARDALGRAVARRRAADGSMTLADDPRSHDGPPPGGRSEQHPRTTSSPSHQEHSHAPAGD